MILCIGTSPAVQRVMIFPRLKLDSVNRAVTTLDGVAGKSINVAKVLKELGEQPFAVGFLGGQRGEFVRAILNAKEIEHEFVSVANATRQCVTVIDQSAPAITELVEESAPVAPADYEQLWQIIERRVPGSRAMIMSGTLAPGGPPDFYRRCTERAAQAQALAIVDAQGVPLQEALKARPDLIKPNRQELAATVGRELPDEATTLEAMRELSDRGARRVVVTAGGEPTLAFDGCNSWRTRSAPVTAVNPIGSGDAFTAGLTWRLLKGDDLGEACRWGAAAGAANALTQLAGEVDQSKVHELATRVVVERLC